MTSSTELKSFPPVSDTIALVKQVDWKEVGERVRGGIRNLLLVALVTSEKSYDFHQFLLAKLDGEETATEDTKELFEDTKKDLDGLSIWKSDADDAEVPF